MLFQVAGLYLILIMSINNKAAFLRVADASCQVNLFHVSKSSCKAPHFDTAHMFLKYRRNVPSVNDGFGMNH